jgi:hypothetical protein
MVLLYGIGATLRMWEGVMEINTCPALDSSGVPFDLVSDSMATLLAVPASCSRELNPACSMWTIDTALVTTAARRSL